MTKIEWTDETWNPITGCTPISEGCQNCYAKRMANRLRGRCGYQEDEPFRVTAHRDKLDMPERWKKPRMVFVCSMGDLFHDMVTNYEIHTIWDVMKACPQHIFMVLTKRPERMREALKMIYSKERMGWSMGFWNHVWLGVTCENQQRADERIPILLQIPAAVRFVSCEPMLGPIDLKEIEVPAKYDELNRSGHYPSKFNALTTEYDDVHYHQPPASLNWVICGGETGHGARPMHPDWARSLREQCQDAGVPFFFKKHGNNKDRLLDGQIWEQWPNNRP